VDYLLWYLRGRKDEVDVTRRDGAVGHTIEFGCGRILCNHESSFFLDRRDAFCSVGACTRQNHAYRKLSLIRGQRMQENIYGVVGKLQRKLVGQDKPLVDDGDELVVGDHIDAALADVEVVRRLEYIHIRVA